MRGRVPALAAALLASGPAGAQPVGAVECGGHAAELFADAGGGSLVVDGQAIALAKGPDYMGPVCVAKDGQTLIGFTEFMGNAYEVYRLVDPDTLAVSEITYPEAEALGWWD